MRKLSPLLLVLVFILGACTQTSTVKPGLEAVQFRVSDYDGGAQRVTGLFFAADVDATVADGSIDVEGLVTLELEAPRSTDLRSFEESPGVSVSDTNVKIATIDHFQLADDSTIEPLCGEGCDLTEGERLGYLVYVDRDVSISLTPTADEEVAYEGNLNLERGWHFLVSEVVASNAERGTVTFRVTVDSPNVVEWRWNPLPTSIPALESAKFSVPDYEWENGAVTGFFFASEEDVVVAEGSIDEGGLVTLALKAPRAEQLRSFQSSPGVSISDSSVRTATIDHFRLSNGSTIHLHNGDEHSLTVGDRLGYFVYVDRDVSISLAPTADEEVAYEGNLNLERGWHFLVSEVVASNTKLGTVAFRVTEGNPDDMNWEWDSSLETTVFTVSDYEGEVQPAEGFYYPFTSDEIVKVANGSITEDGGVTLVLEAPTEASLMPVSELFEGAISDPEAGVAFLDDVVLADGTEFYSYARLYQCTDDCSEIMVGDRHGTLIYVDRDVSITIDVTNLLGIHTEGHLDLRRGWQVLVEEITVLDMDAGMAALQTYVGSPSAIEWRQWAPYE